jgi:hypothetical protein
LRERDDPIRARLGRAAGEAGEFRVCRDLLDERLVPGVDDVDDIIGAIGEIIALGAMVDPADVVGVQQPAVLLAEVTGTGIVFSNLTALPLFCAMAGLAINRAVNADTNQERPRDPSLLSIWWFLPRCKALSMSRKATFCRTLFRAKVPLKRRIFVQPAGCRRGRFLQSEHTRAPP